MRDWLRRRWLTLKDRLFKEPDDGKEGKSIRELGGEYMRDASVLVLVFGFLDPVIDPRSVEHFGWSLWSLAVLGLSFLTLGVGGMLEVSRRNKMGPLFFMIAFAVGVVLLGTAALLWPEQKKTASTLVSERRDDVHNEATTNRVEVRPSAVVVQPVASTSSSNRAAI